MPAPPIRCSSSGVGGAATTLLLLALLQQAGQGAAQFNAECGVGETPLKMKIGGTDRLTKCTDFFDDVVRSRAHAHVAGRQAGRKAGPTICGAHVPRTNHTSEIADLPEQDPYAIVTVGSDRLGVSKMTVRIDNTDTPAWNAMIDFGCVEKDSRISFRVKDWCVLLPLSCPDVCVYIIRGWCVWMGLFRHDRMEPPLLHPPTYSPTHAPTKINPNNRDYFGDETCLGPLSIIDDWPPSGRPALICEEDAINGMGSGCISFAMFYGADAAAAASAGLTIPPVPGTFGSATNGTGGASPFMTPTTPPSGTGPVVSVPGVPPNEPATTTTTTTPTAPPLTPRNTTMPPKPRVSGPSSSPPSPPSPPLPTVTGAGGNTTTTTTDTTTGTAPKRPMVQAPAPTVEAEKAKSARRSKGAAVAGVVITSLALVGVAVGVYASRRRRRREEHAQGVDLEANAGRSMGEAPGSVAVL
jgi:hypothetical protein